MGNCTVRHLSGVISKTTVGNLLINSSLFRCIMQIILVDVESSVISSIPCSLSSYTLVHSRCWTTHFFSSLLHNLYRSLRFFVFCLCTRWPSLGSHNYFVLYCLSNLRFVLWIFLCLRSYTYLSSFFLHTFWHLIFLVVLLLSPFVMLDRFV